MENGLFTISILLQTPHLIIILETHVTQIPFLAFSTPSPKKSSFGRNTCVKKQKSKCLLTKFTTVYDFHLVFGYVITKFVAKIEMIK